MKKPAPHHRWAVSTQAHYPAFERMLQRLAEETGPALLVAGTPQEPSTKDLKVIRGPRYPHAGFAQRAAAWIRFAAFATRALARSDARFFFVVTNPPIMPHAVWALARAKQRRFGVLVWDIYPKALVDVGLLQPDHILVRAWARTNRLLYRDALFVAAPSEEMAKQLVAEGCPKEKLVVIPNWTDIDAIRPLPGHQGLFRKAHRIGDRFLVIYSGNIGAGHSLAGLVDAASLLHKDSRFVFYVIGSGLGLASIRSQVGKLALESIHFLHHLPEKEFRDAIASADLAVISQRPGTEAMSMPSKTYTAMAAGNAILALTEETSSLARLVMEEKIGRLCPPSDGKRIAEELLDLADSPDQVARMGVRARRLAEERYSVDASFRLFRDLFTEALDEREKPT